MRVAKPEELQVYTFPVLTAHITDAEFSDWFQVPVHHITDPQEAAEPSKAALVQLNSGDYFVFYFGELSKRLTLRIPSATDPTRFAHAFLHEVPLPRERIVWLRDDVELSRDRMVSALP
jgi:hypothetical protein